MYSGDEMYNRKEMERRQLVSGGKKQFGDNSFDCRDKATN